MKKGKPCLDAFINFFYCILNNFKNKWNVILSTLLPIIIYGILILLSGRNDFHIRIMDAYVITLSLLFTPILELLFRFFNDDVGDLSIRRFREHIKTKKLVISTLLILIIIILMAFDDSRILFDYSIGMFKVLINVFAVVIVIFSLNLIDLYDDEGVQDAIYKGSKSNLYKIKPKGSE